ncbi:MAG: branched-chain amino acid ABC transporter permease [Desulfobacterales bacterium]|nr:branched-chain amino acid ABC transporter permease [Desulfobacterales bacterium]
MTKESTKWIIVFILLSASTVLFKNHLYVLIYASFFAIFAMSWSFFTSFSGYLNLGHVIFIGIAGYTTAIFNYHLNFPMILSMPIGVIAGAGGGWLLLNPLHRKISGLSFEMVTFLGILVLSDLVLTSYLRPITGADLGISPIDSLLSSFPLIIGLNLFMCISGYLFVRFLNSKHGKVLDFARKNTDLVKTAGLDPHKYSGLCLLYSGIVGAIGGVLYIHFSGSAGVSNTFSLSFQIHMIVMAIIGGRFSMFGSIFGAYFVILLEEYLRGVVGGPVENMIIYSIGFCVYFFSPEGLFPKITGLKKKLIG